MKKLISALMLVALSAGALGVSEAQSLAATRHARTTRHAVSVRKHKARKSTGRKSAGKIRVRKARAHKAKKAPAISPMPNIG